MLTCKVGNTIINCFDGKYDKFTLKKWSEEKRLICPDCNKLYEYCHGEIIHPYFRHKEKNKDCEGIYYEPETEEHIQGKLILYNWLLKIQKDNIIQDVKLESYIPETRQRPDLSFRINDKRYVIEFQCSPIATEYLERHRLYQLAEINDIWILGLSKYNIQEVKNNISHIGRFKTIEQHSNFYLNVDNKKIYFKKEILSRLLPHKLIKLNNYYGYKINDFEINLKFNDMSLKEQVVKSYIEQDIIEFNKIEELIFFENGLNKTVNDFRDLYSDFKFELIKRTNFYYLWSVEFSHNYGTYRFFIKNNRIELCIEYEKSVPFVGKKGGLGWRKERKYHVLDKLEYDLLDNEIISDFISNHILRVKEKHEEEILEIKKQEKYRLDKYSNVFKDYLNAEILLINAKSTVPNNIRFKFLKGFSIMEEYMENNFIKELKFLKRINVKQYIFMIPKYHYYFNSLGFSEYISGYELNNIILEHFKSFGFTNVKYLDFDGEEDINIG